MHVAVLGVRFSGIFGPSGMKAARPGTSDSHETESSGTVKTSFCERWCRYSHRPILKCAANAVDHTRAGGSRRLVKHRGAACAAKFDDGKGNQRPNGKATPRPSHSSVLQDNPLAAPSSAFSKKAPECARPADLIPRHARRLHFNTPLREGSAEKFAVVSNAVGGFITTSEQGNHVRHLAARENRGSTV